MSEPGTGVLVFTELFIVISHSLETELFSQYLGLENDIIST